MLPHAYELPAAIVLVVAGALTCVAGYRLFRFVLAIWGFILGAGIGSSMMSGGSAVWMVGAGLVGGIAGALALVFAYFVGVALVGAGLGALVTHVIWSQSAPGDPPAALIIGASVAGAIAAMVLQRYVIVVGTAFAGAWLLVVGGAALNASMQNRSALTLEVWILYPLTPAPGQPWVLAAWVVAGLIGVGVQLAYGGNKKGR
jgi:hypothetical protein